MVPHLQPLVSKGRPKFRYTMKKSKLSMKCCMTRIPIMPHRVFHSRILQKYNTTFKSLDVDCDQLTCNNIVPKEEWVSDHEISHCSVCVRKFALFRRRHHCRTCGVVVCSRCSDRVSLRLTERDESCVARMCTFCVSKAQEPRHSESADSTGTNGSVVQIWPGPSNNDTPKLTHIGLGLQEHDNKGTLGLFVQIVANALGCPVAYLALSDGPSLEYKAVSCSGQCKVRLPEEDVLSLLQLQGAKDIWTVADTKLDDRFHSLSVTINEQQLRFYTGILIQAKCRVLGVLSAIDVVPKGTLSECAISTLMSVKDALFEVFGHRVGLSPDTNDGHRSDDEHSESSLAGERSVEIVFNKDEMVGEVGKWQQIIILCTQFLHNVLDFGGWQCLTEIDQYYSIDNIKWKGNIKSDLSINVYRSTLEMSANGMNDIIDLIYMDKCMHREFLMNEGIDAMQSEPRRSLNESTWIHLFGSEPYQSYKILTHVQRIHETSCIISVILLDFEEDKDIEGSEVEIEDGAFLFGWLIDGNHKVGEFSVTCIVTHHYGHANGPSFDPKLCIKWCRQLQQELF